MFIEHERKPIAVWKDPAPLLIQYYGFASYENSLARYFFNCIGEQPQTESSLSTQCKQTQVSEYEYNQFVPIPAGQPEGYLISLLVHIKADRDAHILLSPKTEINDIDAVYEIRKCVKQFLFVIIYYYSFIRLRSARLQHAGFWANLFAY